MSLRICNVDKSLFEITAHDDKVAGISRNDLITSGRLCTMEYVGRTLNTLRGLSENGEGYNCKMDKMAYRGLSKGHWEKKLIYCATMAAAAVGKKAPTSVKEVQNNVALQKDQIFLRAMAEIDREIISPLFFDVESDIMGSFLNFQPVPMGSTKEIIIHSNEAFLFEDSSWGSGSSATYNYLYNDTVTLTPKLKECNTRIKWYQLVATDGSMDAGWYYTAIMLGLRSKIMAQFTNALTTAAASTAYVPSYLNFGSYSSANWRSAVTKVAAANGVSRDRLFAYGTLGALSNVLPNGTSSDAALTYGLGEEWMRNGFLAVVNGVSLIEVNQALVPGTVNTTGSFLFPDDKIYVAARAGEGYAPMYGVYAEGSPITTEYEPSQTADFSIDIKVGALFDIAPIFASKIAVIDT